MTWALRQHCRNLTAQRALVLLDRLNLNLDILTYKARWQHHSIGKISANILDIPFPRNTVNLPPSMPKVFEDQLICLKNDIIRLTIEETKKLKKDKKFTSLQKQVRATKTFLKQNDFVAVPSDKSNRLVVTEKDSFDARNLALLNDTSTYKRLSKSKQTSIEAQANKLINSVCKNLTRTEREKLLASGSAPAAFYAFVKDHKEKRDDNFPLRPIASVKNTAIEKVDWLLSKILGQLVYFVPANIKNSSEIIQILNEHNTSGLDPSYTFISLDVVSLYPSIPITDGIKAVLDFAAVHWSKIKVFGLTLDDLRRCLTFVCYNYEIKYNDVTYLQIKGCPMGAHFAPPFAILMMHEVETKALSRLATRPKIYKRYIDDVILGPYKRDDPEIQNIVDTFNAVDQSIQFTVDVPSKDEPLNFLDIAIFIDKEKINYSWYSKPCHSENTLRSDSWLPRHVKTNFLKNAVKTVISKCSTEEHRNNALTKLRQRFRKNGYKNVDPQSECNQKKTKKKNSDTQKVHLQLNFLNDRYAKNVNKILQKYDFPFSIQSVFVPSKSITQCFKNPTKTVKHENCEICPKMHDDLNCSHRFLVYKFTCVLCNEFYIGQTNRPFKLRFNEHKRSIVQNNLSSALAEHASKAHANRSMTISDFDLQILRSCHTPLETRLTEAKMISLHRPNINRKHEIASL